MRDLKPSIGEIYGTIMKYLMDILYSFSSTGIKCKKVTGINQQFEGIE
jgi:hypothetical protein